MKFSLHGDQETCILIIRKKMIMGEDIEYVSQGQLLSCGCIMEILGHIRCNNLNWRIRLGTKGVNAKR